MRRRSADIAWSTIPSVIVLSVMWTATLVRLDTGAALNYWTERLMQSAGSTALEKQPMETLASLHIQPPLWNALLAIDTHVTPTSHLLILAVNTTAAFATLFVVSGTLLLMGVPRLWSVAATCLLALLPGMSAYTFLAYSTTLCGLLAALTVAGVAMATRTRHVTLGVAVSASAVALLFLLRPAIVWVFVVFWLVCLFVLASRVGLTRRRAITTLAPSLAIVLLAQGYYLLAFGLPAMSSWNGENLAHGLLESGNFPYQAEAFRDRPDDRCPGELVRAGPWPDPKTVPACLDGPAPPPTGVIAWDAPTKDNVGLPNYNYGPRLEVSKAWTALMLDVLVDDPLLLLRMAFVPNMQPSGAALYLSASDDYVLLAPIIEAQPPWVRALRVWGTAFAPAAFLCTLLGLALLALRHGGRAVRSWTYLMGCALVGYSAFVGILMDYSENNRFRAEIDPALMMVAVLAVWAIVSAPRQRQGLTDPESRMALLPQ